MSADAVIRFGGTTIPVKVRGAQGPRGPAGPDTGEAIEEAIAGLAPIGTVSAALDDGNDQYAIIAAELADPAVSELVLPDGTFLITQGLVVPGGKWFRAQGPGRTTLKAMAGFEDSVDNATMVLMQGVGARVSDMTIDASKCGNGEASNKRCNGAVADNGCTNYLRQNLIVMNCSGYGVYDAGDEDRTNPPSGRNENITTMNCQVHYEPQGVDGVTYEDCTALDGDGDIPCLQWFHPLVGSRKVNHYSCRGYGAVGAGVDLTANVADLEEILFDSCDFEVTGATVAFSVTAGAGETKGLRIVNSRFHSEGYTGMVLNKASGSMTNVRVRGWPLGIESNLSKMELTGCDALGEQPAPSGTAAKGISAPGDALDGGIQIRMNGGSVRAVGSTGPVAYEGSVQISATTELEPSGSTQAILNRYAGVTAAIQSASPNSYAILNLPFNVTDWDNVHVNVGARRATDDGVLLPAACAFSFVPFGGGNAVRIYVKGADLSTGGWTLTAELIEWA